MSEREKETTKNESENSIVKEKKPLGFSKMLHEYPRRRPMKFRINWEEVKNSYIFAEPIIHAETQSYRYPTLADVAKQHNIGVGSVYIKAQETKPTWTDQRKMYHAKMKQLHDLEYGVMQLRRSSEFDSHNLRRLDKFSSIFDVWLEDLEDQIVNKNGYKDPESEASSPPLGIKDMKEAMTVMKDMHKLNRDILGEPVNYYEFYKEKLKEERHAVEKGKAVTRDEIRDLISAVRKETNEVAQLTLDVSSDEETIMRKVKEFVDDDEEGADE